jgi:hypothetical protein
MSIRLPNSKILQIHYLLRQAEVANGTFSRKLAFAFAKLLHATEPIAAAFQAIRMPREAQKAYENRRVAILSELCEKDERGQNRMRKSPDGIGVEFSISPEKMEEAKARMRQLDQEMPEAVAEEATRFKELDELAKEETDLDISPIPLSLFPSTVPENLIATLYDVILDDDDPAARNG